MARSRMIKPEFWDDEKLATQTSRDARLVFIGLWTHADDYGVVKGNSVWLKNHILPYEDSLSIQKFSAWLTELAKGHWIIPFEDNGEKFYYIKNFSRHQTINRPSKQRNAVPPNGLTEGSCNTHGGITSQTETETETETEVATSSSSLNRFKEVAKNYYSHLQQKFPNRKIQATNGKVQKGAETLRKLEEIDEFNLENEIKPALRWALDDDFWHDKVLSLAELRRKRSDSENHKFFNLFQRFMAQAEKKQSDDEVAL